MELYQGIGIFPVPLKGLENVLIETKQSHTRTRTSELQNQRGMETVKAEKTIR